MSCVLVTGARGFIGKNLVLRLREMPGFTVKQFVRGDDPKELPKLVSEVDFVVHLAGTNRPENPREFDEVNSGLTGLLCDTARACGKKVSLILASSTQAELGTPYGRSKRAAEQKISDFADATGMSATIFRLPGVFGKWSSPNYNSVVATFCHNIARDLPIEIRDPATELRLVYIDDVVAALVAALDPGETGLVYRPVEPEYMISLGELAAQIRAFRACRTSLILERVGAGLVRALYSTYVSFLPKQSFTYEIPQYSDERGVFVEMLKTPDAGQFSYFTARPGISRGGHYHHTKTEKFLVIKGRALFRFRHLLTDERHELTTSSDKPEVVETIPGWSHDITNIGEEELFVMLWANEIFDRTRPDTIQSKV